jgi:hypothetical protein
MESPPINTEADLQKVLKRLAERQRSKSWSDYAGSPEGRAEYEAWENAPQEIKDKILNGDLE